MDDEPVVDRVERYRLRAHELRITVGNFEDEDSKASILQLALAYEQLAHALEKAAEHHRFDGSEVPLKLG